MHFNPYGGVAAQIAVDLVNDGPARAEVIGNLLREHGYKPLPAVTTAQADALNRWAVRLRPAFDDQAPLTVRVELLNGLLAAAAAKPYISQHDDRAPHLHFADERADLVARVSAYTAAGIAHVLCEDPERLGTCHRDGCSVVFVDTSRNGRRRFCSTRCANRVHVADHRKRAAVA
jgi:predicted RNA-binding Zn ribbon-like protein